jgi:hypothetical protein
MDNNEARLLATTLASLITEAHALAALAVVKLEEQQGVILTPHALAAARQVSAGQLLDRLVSRVPEAVISQTFLEDLATALRDLAGRVAEDERGERTPAQALKVVPPEHEDDQ